MTDAADKTPLVSVDGLFELFELFEPLELQADKNSAATDALMATFEKLMTNTGQTLSGDNIVSRNHTKARLSI